MIEKSLEMNKYILLLVLCLSSFVVAMSQTIKVVMPENANLSYVFALNKGLKSDTVASGNFSVTGEAKIIIPGIYKDYKGAGFLQVEGKPLTLIVVNNESFTITSKDGVLDYGDSKENKAIYTSDMVLKSDTLLYANRFLELMDYLKRQNAVVSGLTNRLGDKFQVLQFAKEALDVDALYTSGLWYYAIDGILKLSIDQESFADVMLQMLDRTMTDDTYLALSVDLVTIFNQYGLDNAFDIVVPHIMKSGRIEYPQGDLFDAFQMAKLTKGSLVPEIKGLSKASHTGKFLLLFFESDCQNCRVEIEKLKDRYKELEAKNVKVITISADINVSDYKQFEKEMPWKDRLCDYKGFSGTNFQNFGVIATPTYYLLDSERRLIGRYSSISNIEL